MEEVYRSGKVKAIGVSNWSVPYLEHLKKTWTVTPAVNQVFSTFRIGTRLVIDVERSNYTHITHSTNSRRGATATAFFSRHTALSARQVHLPPYLSPKTHGNSFLGAPLLEDEEISGIAKKNGISPATVLISYQVNRGCIVLPKSVTASRIEQNLKVVELPKEDMDALNAMAAGGKQKRVNTPAWGHDLVCFLNCVFVEVC